MRRVLYISLILYLPLLITAGADLFGDFRPETFGSRLFRALFVIWVLDGSACLVAGIALLRRLVRRAILPGSAAWWWPLSIAGVIAGIPPAYILVELAVKLAWYLS
ncbi:MAG TPA: hypothetical protein VM658_10325 [bacterium]|nr:hypothetical protein [bacterium]